MQNYALNSREVAEMIDKDHSDLLKDIRKYVGYLNEGGFPSVDFFAESNYVDSKGQKRPCYEVTRKGCDMIANKMTGQKGTLFTASYINKFHEMEARQLQLSPPYDTTKAISIGEVANLIKVTVPVMTKQGSSASEIAEQMQLFYTQFGIKTIINFVKPSPYEQLSLPVLNN